MKMKEKRIKSESMSEWVSERENAREASSMSVPSLQTKTIFIFSRVNDILSFVLFFSPFICFSDCSLFFL